MSFAAVNSCDALTRGVSKQMVCDAVGGPIRGGLGGAATADFTIRIENSLPLAFNNDSKVTHYNPGKV